MTGRRRVTPCANSSRRRDGATCMGRSAPADSSGARTGNGARRRSPLPLRGFPSCRLVLSRRSFLRPESGDISGSLPVHPRHPDSAPPEQLLILRGFPSCRLVLSRRSFLRPESGDISGSLPVHPRHPDSAPPEQLLIILSRLTINCCEAGGVRKLRPEGQTSCGGKRRYAELIRS